MISDSLVNWIISVSRLISYWVQSYHTFIVLGSSIECYFYSNWLPLWIQLHQGWVCITPRDFISLRFSNLLNTCQLWLTKIWILPSIKLTSIYYNFSSLEIHPRDFTHYLISNKLRLARIFHSLASLLRLPFLNLINGTSLSNLIIKTSTCLTSLLELPLVNLTSHLEFTLAQHYH